MLKLGHSLIWYILVFNLTNRDTCILIFCFKWKNTSIDLLYILQIDDFI